MNWKSLTRTALMLALVLSFRGGAFAAVISINFTGGDGGSGVDSGKVPASVTGVAGVQPVANWNNAAGGDGTLSSLLNSNGAATAASVTWSSPNMWSTAAANGASPTPDANLLGGYLDTGDINGEYAVATLTNIPFARYHVVAYFSGDVPALTRTASYRLEGAGPTQERFVTNLDGTVPFDGTFVNASYSSLDAAQNGVGSNFLAFPLASGSSFTLTAIPRDFRAPLSGIQIVETTSVAGDVNGDGSVTIADFDELRSNFLNKVPNTLAFDQGDLNLNGVVDLDDFRAWKAAFGGGGPSSVPEPSAVVLLCVGGAGLFWARRHRTRG
jgi:hypothetical protein